jgi:uncharacterized protein with HEPN domain
VPPRYWKSLLGDVLNCIERITEYTRDLTFEEFGRNPMCVDAVLHNFTILGEAASQVPLDVQLRLHSLPWRQMRGMRNTIVHSYSSVRLAVVWETAQNDLPGLVPLVKAALADASEEPGASYEP